MVDTILTLSEIAWKVGMRDAQYLVSSLFIRGMRAIALMLAVVGFVFAIPANSNLIDSSDSLGLSFNGLAAWPERRINVRQGRPMTMECRLNSEESDSIRQVRMSILERSPNPDSQIRMLRSCKQTLHNTNAASCKARVRVKRGWSRYYCRAVSRDDSGNKGAASTVGFVHGITVREEQQAIQKRITRDAVVLTYRDIQAGTIQSDSLRLPSARIKYYVEALTKILEFAKSNDQITDLGRINTTDNSLVKQKQLIVFLDQDCPWADNWKAGNIGTPSRQLNDLIQTYQLEIDNFKNSNLFAPQVSTWGILKSRVPLDTERLANMLNEVEGIRSADPDGTGGGGDDIRAKLNDDGLHELTWSRGWGDCSAGCIYRTYWKFEIQEDGSIEYLGRSGDDRSVGR